MKKIISVIVFLTIVTLSLFVCCDRTTTEETTFTNVIISNTSKEDSVKVFVTLQVPNSVVGLFGIQANDTIGSCSKGFFYAHKDSSYQSNTPATLFGGVISFGGDNLPCQVAVQQGFYTGINIFEFSINTPSECFDISCEDGVNSIINASVSDTINWATGDGLFIKKFRSAQNTFPIIKNIGIRGVFPYRCTDCKDLGKAIPQNCFNLPDTCNTERICQVARTNNNGGNIFVNYVGKAWEVNSN